MNKKAKYPQKVALLAVLRGISQVELAKRLGMQPSHLNHFLKGRGDVRSAQLLRILRELGIDVEEALNREVAALSGMKLEGKDSVGEAFESVAKALSPEDRHAMLGYIVRMAQLNLGTKARAQTKLLKAWMQ